MDVTVRPFGCSAGQALCEGWVRAGKAAAPQLVRHGEWAEMLMQDYELRVLPI